MTILPSKVISKLQQNQQNVRNICVLAHVDHGKTSICDSLIASNGIISKKLTGKVRYLDYREDEQQRQITMKSTAISLYAQNPEQTEHYLINLVDSPGHVDFSGEVSSAVRVTDGAIVVVDCVEGVCVQTNTVIRQAAADGLHLVLVINKIDRLVFEKSFSIDEATSHLEILLASINKITSLVTDQSGLVFGENYFDPIKGNVVFASAIDGWGFDLEMISTIYSKRFGMKTDALKSLMWGEHYINMKTGKTYKTQVENTVKCFSYLALRPVWEIYTVVKQYFDKETHDKALAKIQVMVKSLNLNISARELEIHEEKSFLFSMMSGFLPVAKSILSMVITHLPSPLVAQKTRLLKLCHPNSNYLKKEIELCAKDTAQTVLYSGKVFPFHNQMIAMCRVFCGVVKNGDKLYILPPKYIPTDDESVNTTINTFTVEKLYLLMGQTVQEMEEVPAGSIVGIPVNETQVFKAATLSTTLKCSPLMPLVSSGAKPILPVAIEPVKIEDMERLKMGLHLLTLSDPSVDTTVKDTGEIVLYTTGELHLERCVKDLKEIFAKVPFNTTDPLVTYKETVLGKSPSVEIGTLSGNVTFKMTNFGLKDTNVVLVDGFLDQLRSMSDEENENKIVICGKIAKIIEEENIKGKIIAFGPGKIGNNILVNKTPIDFGEWPNVVTCETEKRVATVYDGMISAFEEVTRKGPMCDEEMEGVVFVLERLVFADSETPITTNEVKEAITTAMIESFEKGKRRMKEPVYYCEVRAPSEVVGKVFQVLDKRRAKILEDDYDETQNLYVVKSQLPVVESFGFTTDILGQTSGSALSQTKFDCFVTMAMDPYWTPKTADELEEFGEKADVKNIAKMAMENTRKRKGLVVDNIDALIDL
ncbi:elongation factor, putative [Entamoeba invadens IP1]|uniref:elongation factor, putative n=1 Tax=Entamoeba invadens IP1 TaxID=370355 RepID=UPI0002C3F5B3|nr:elongation factor, putative [Entamoeba invadens IP1]ELP93278.1 elongation factor, putative [Entamoeba invadens IP1]|eukprot:XP_004260049.1 elongation factor, putative [Entamoeba invadens IP1]